MLQSQKRQVRQFLSSTDIDSGQPNYDMINNNNNRTSSSLPHHPGITENNLLAPPILEYPSLTASAPAENSALLSKDNPPATREAVDQGI